MVELQYRKGCASRKMVTNEAIKALNEIAENLKASGVLRKSIGTLKASEPVQIESLNNTVIKKLEKRGITKEQAQSFIDGSDVMFEQNNGEKRLYISHDGNSAILMEGKRLLSAYPASDFDSGMKRLVEEIKKYE